MRRVYSARSTFPSCKPVFLNRRARGPVPGPGINYTGPLEVLLEFLVYKAFFINKYSIVEIFLRE
jgi:hypothetical protein